MSTPGSESDAISAQRVSFAALGVCVSSVAGIGSLLESKLPENLQDTPQSISRFEGP